MVRRLILIGAQAAASVMGGAASQVAAQCPPRQVSEIVPAFPSGGMGQSVSMSGEYAIIGANLDDRLGENAGAAHMLLRTDSGWIVDSEIRASDAAANDNFGYSVSISGDRAIVGAYLDTNQTFRSGSAYIFRREGAAWVQEAKLLAPVQALQHYFGSAVAISKDVAIVGARFDGEHGPAAGAAFVYRRAGTQWPLEAKLVPVNPASNDQFGISVAIENDRALIGAVGRDTAGGESGSAFVFRFEGGQWTQQAELVAVDAVPNQILGYAVALMDDLALVGSQYADAGANNAGAAYLFRETDEVWAHEWKFVPNQPVAEDQFGASVALAPELVYIGGPYNDEAATNRGAAWLFVKSGAAWTQVQKVTPVQQSLCGGPTSGFGSAVALDLNHMITGASLSGEAFIHDVARPGAFVRSPESVGVLPGSEAVVLAARFEGGSGYHAVHWRRNSVPLVDGPAPGGGELIGTTSLTLILTSPAMPDAGLYDCVVIDPCAFEPSVSSAAHLVVAAPPCPGDANLDDSVTFADVTSVLANFGMVCP